MNTNIISLDNARYLLLGMDVSSVVKGGTLEILTEDITVYDLATIINPGMRTTILELSLSNEQFFIYNMVQWVCEVCARGGCKLDIIGNENRIKAQGFLLDLSITRKPIRTLFPHFDTGIFQESSFITDAESIIIAAEMELQLTECEIVHK